eukprot:TRINITY_DN573_c0_g1_i1.p1 TRINITY_DN573_c0_g1~~TRINITY_DN573_c0_g1_i1.p1  ORF type:complete len:358 (-),score=52.71 TRINITY_DN573_c0_g1_i1:146-1219(-)
MKLLLVLLSLAAILFPSQVSSSPECTYYYLSPSGSDEIGNGTQVMPWLTLNYTLTQVTPGDVIVFEPGLYEGPQNIVDIKMDKLNFQSSNTSAQVILSCGNDPSLTMNILKGYLFMLNLVFQDCDTMLSIQKNQVTLYNISFSNHGTAVNLAGDTSSLIIDQCQFENNRIPINTDTLGNGSVTIMASSFVGNGPVVSGAGASVSIYESLFTQCSSIEGDAGCILNNGILIIENSTFTDNSQHTENGGAIWSGAGAISINNTVFDNNVVTNDGGALYLSNTYASIVNCTFSNNSADRYGGAIALADANLSAWGSSFVGNDAGKNGGALGCLNNYNSITLTNCTQTSNNPVSSCSSSKS